MRKFTLSQWCAELERQIAAIKPAATAALEEIGPAVVSRAREKIGHYQGASGPFPAWTPLAPATVADKTALGYAPPDNPELRHGDLRDSIGYSVAPLTLEVGSPDPVARFQEHGTATMPPRPSIGPAMLESEPLARAHLSRALARVLSSEPGSPAATLPEVAE